MAFTANVARIAGVSPSTVSLVVNRKGRVSPDTRRKVQEAIEQLGYTAPRRHTARKGSLEIAVVYGRESIRDGAMSAVTQLAISGIRERVIEENGHMGLFQGQNHVNDDMILRERLESDDVDGVILFSARRQEGYLDYLLRLGKPLVVLNRQPRFNECSAVSLDYYHGGELQVEHLASLGHRHLAVIDGPHDAWPGRPLWAGVVATMRKQRCQLSYAKTLATYESITKRVVDEMLDSGATALITSDYRAAQLSAMLDARGVRVPEDLSVIGFDDLGIELCEGRPLTTIGYDKNELGRSAAEAILQLKSSDRQISQTSLTLGVCLVQGQSTAPVNAAERQNAHNEGVATMDELIANQIM